MNPAVLLGIGIHILLVTDDGFLIKKRFEGDEAPANHEDERGDLMMEFEQWTVDPVSLLLEPSPDLGDHRKSVSKAWRSHLLVSNSF